MDQRSIAYQPIGVLRTPFTQAQGGPIQSSGARGVAGRAEIDPAYAEGLKDLEGFSHLILIYHCHLSGPCQLTVKPFLDDESHGVLATRAQARPNPIGLSVVRLQAVQGSTLLLEDVDMLDGSPLLDLKPYVTAFDAPLGESRQGWLERKGGQAGTLRADDRFTPTPKPSDGR